MEPIDLGVVLLIYKYYGINGCIYYSFGIGILTVILKVIVKKIE